MKYLLTLLVSVFFFAMTFASAPTEFTRTDLIYINSLLAGVLAVEFLIAYMFGRYRVLQNLVLAGFATINILYLNLAINEVFVHLPRYGHVLFLLLVMFILYTFMNMLDENPMISRLLPAILAIATIVVVGQALYSIKPVPEMVAKPGKTTADNIRLVDFKSKPNVYFISFDSIIPRALFQKTLGMESAAYHDAFDAHFRRFENFFADRVTTKPSLNSLLALDIAHYSSVDEKGISPYFFSGRIPSPLLEIFKHNGYETTTLFRGGYLGWEKGPHVDNYRIDMLHSKSGVCEFIPTFGLRAPMFMGYCHLMKSGPVVDEQTEEIDYLLDNMRTASQKEAPQMFVAHIYSPGHTDLTYNRNNPQSVEGFKQHYLEESKKTADYIHRIVSFIAEEDEEAILYVYGDHGALVTKTGDFEEDPVFYVQDRYGVYGGIHPPERCAESFARPYNENFMTISQGAHMILRCLSGGQDAFLTLKEYRLPESDTNGRNRYEDYLYE